MITYMGTIYYTRRECSTITGLSERSITQLIHSRKLKSSKIRSNGRDYIGIEKDYFDKLQDNFLSNCLNWKMICSKSQDNALVFIRCYVTDYLLSIGETITSIGKFLQRDHSTIIHYKQNREQILSNPLYKKYLDWLTLSDAKIINQYNEFRLQEYGIHRRDLFAGAINHINNTIRILGRYNNDETNVFLEKLSAINKELRILRKDFK